MESKTSKDENPTPTTNAGTSSVAASKNKADETSTAQFDADAQLMSEFENSGASGKSFDYAESVPHAAQALCSDENISDYLSKIQRGNLVQSVGCTLVFNSPPDSKIIAHSENCYEMLGVPNLVGPGLIGTDVRNLFTLSSSPQNPILVYSHKNRKPFYAILHKNDSGIIIDLEPIKDDGRPSDPVHSQKIAVKAVSRLQSLPGGSIGILCDAVVKEVRKLTGYDRVMVYKFHEDEHGEVVSESRRADLEPYLGLHYPATDIPQVVRFLYKKSRVRMICDCNSEPVKIVQSPEIVGPLSLVDSTLLAPHACHVEYMINMGSIASLVLAIVVNDGVDESTRLWGLVVCHHTGPRHVPFPRRYACQFLVQAFSLQLRQLVDQLAKKRSLRMQRLLCEMLLRDAPHGIITQSPSIMNLVKCDGAALYYKGKSWLIGVTPDESQVKDIAEWVMTKYWDCTGLSTDCLADIYPKAVTLGDAVCGMTAARIGSTDLIFWFRSHTAKEVKWGGDKHHNGKMHPGTSFSAFLEVMKRRSLPWEAAEIDAVHSLQLIVRDTIREYVEDVCFVGEDITGEKTVMDKFISLKGDYESTIEIASLLIPPIFGSDENARCSEWNVVMENLTGYTRHEMIGKLLPGEVFGDLCKLKDENFLTEFSMLLHKAIDGHETPGKLGFRFYDQRGKIAEMHLTVNKKVNESGRAIGCLCFLQTIMVSNEKEDWTDDNNELANLKEEPKNPLREISFTRQLFELLDKSSSCESQLLSIIDKEAGEGEMGLKEDEFLLGSVVNAIVSRAMISLRKKNLRLVNDIPEKVKNMRLCGDEIKLQSALSDFLECIAIYTHSPDGWVEFKVPHVLKLVKDGVKFVHLQFRMVHKGQGLPQDLIKEMYGGKSWKTRQGFALNICRKIVSKMNGNVCYVKDQNECYFQVDIEFKAGENQDEDYNNEGTKGFFR
ncbi:hypothetical protein CASFOL_040824 [Castilleja foliolosa]|uniref:Phytochrome n=1 Tax=Castilleja foliolosa TaxID=1961234 RepID=A0ABD3BCQ5_9LAMI